MAEIRNGLVVVRTEEEDALLLAESGHSSSYDTLGVGTSTGGLGGSVRSSRLRRSGCGGSFPTRPPPGCSFDHDHHDPAGDENRHFLDSCYMCKRPLGTDQDIFMYRGNLPFCSEECRQDQIDTDEMKGRKWSNLAAKAMLSVNAAAAARNKETVRVVNRATGTVVA